MTSEQYEEFESLFWQFYHRFDISRITAEQMITHLKKDKKRISKDLTMILSQGVGKQLKVNDITPREFSVVYGSFMDYYCDQLNEWQIWNNSFTTHERA